MYAGTTMRGPSAQTSAIDLHGDHFRNGFHENGEFVVALKSDFAVSILDQFTAECNGHAMDVARTDLDTGQMQGVSGIGKGSQSGSSLGNHLQHRGTVTVVIQTQRDPQGEKSPACSWDRSKRLLAE